MKALTQASGAPTEILLRAMIDRSPKWARRLVLCGYRGSHAHGTYLPPEDPHSTDDVDVFGVYVASREYYSGVTGYLRQHDTFTSAGEELDVESHELRKFLHLLCKGNPNVHSHLWLDPADYFMVSRAGRVLVARRAGFLSQKVLWSFTGYAYDQLARMTKFEKHGYMGAKREKVVQEHGFDIKNAAHCLRLLYTGIELARSGKLVIKLTGEVRDTVLAVKRGEWSFERVQGRARTLFEQFHAEKDTSVLPPTVDYQFADETAVAVLDAYHEDLEQVA
jgi:predicted nucleotidyltransferase